MTSNSATGLSEHHFWSITWPIFIDNFLRMSIVLITYWLFSRISDQTTAVMSIANSYLLIGFTLAESLAQSGIIPLTQYLGAGENEGVRKTAATMIWISAVMGLLINLFFWIYPNTILHHLTCEQNTIQQGCYYLTIVGSGFCFYTINYALIYILNAHGFTRLTMWNSLGVNGITLLLSLFAIVFLTASQLELIIYLGFINIGVRILSFCFLLTMARIFTNEVRLFWRFSKKDLKKQGMIFLKITLPSLLEPLSYQFYQMVLIYIIAIISIESLAIRSYVISIIGLLEVSSLSLAKGNQIILGHLFGQREFSSVKKQLKRGITYALSIAIFLSITTLIWKDSLISFFSKNQDVIKIGSNLLVLSTILIFLRAWTYQISNGLKAAGDVRYCVFVMNFCAWGMTIPGAFFCVHFLGLGLNSIWFMLILDELIRGLLLWQRWRNEKWRLSILTNP